MRDKKTRTIARLDLIGTSLSLSEDGRILAVIPNSDSLPGFSVAMHIFVLDTRPYFRERAVSLRSAKRLIQQQ